MSNREIGFVFIVIAAAILIIMAQPVKFFEPDELCYYYSSKNIMENHWVLTQSELSNSIAEAKKRSPLWPHNLGYVKYKDRFVLVKAPGFPVYLALLRKLHSVILGNALLVLLGVVAILLAFQKNLISGTVLTSVILLIFSPITLVMAYRVFMSDFAAAMVLLIGGMLIILRNSHYEKISLLGWSIDFTASFFLGGALILRYTNGISVIFLLSTHIIFALFPRKNNLSNTRDWVRVFISIIGFCIPLIGLVIYNKSVFNEWFASGYLLQNIKPQDKPLIFLQILRGHWKNVAETVLRNLTVLPQILICSFPWILLAPAGLLKGWHTIERRVYILSAGWITGILLVFLQYRMLMPHIFVIIGRMYLPLAAPMALLTANYIHHNGKSFALIVRIITIVLSIVFFVFFLNIIKVPFFRIDLSPWFGNINEVLCLMPPCN